MQVKDLNIPNILSIARIFLAFIFAILLFRYYKFPALGIFLLAGITDILDGYLARKNGQVTVLGRILDPTADRLLMILAFLILFLKYNLPIWLLLLAFVYHVAIALGWLYVFKYKKIALPHIFWGKLNAVIESIMICVAILNFYPSIFFIVTAGSLIFSFLVYFYKFIKIILKRETGAPI